MDPKIDTSSKPTEEGSGKKSTRRGFLKLAGLVVGGGTLAIVAKKTLDKKFPPQKEGDYHSSFKGVEELPYTHAAHYQGGFVSCGNKVYIFGGKDMCDYDRHPITKILESFAPGEPEWVKEADMLETRSHMGTFSLDELIYSVGGVQSDQLPTRSVFRYDVTNKKWTQMNNFPIDIISPLVTKVKGVPFIMGGKLELGVTQSSGFRYDAGNDVWIPIKDMPISVAETGIASLGDNIYVFGGIHREGGKMDNLKLMQVYDTKRNEWYTEEMPWKLSAGHSFEVGDEILTFVDCYSTSTKDIAYGNDGIHRFSPLKKEWSITKVELPYDFRFEDQLVLLNGHLYYTGGIWEGGVSRMALRWKLPELKNA